MIKISVDLLPQGDDYAVQSLGVVEISCVRNPQFRGEDALYEVKLLEGEKTVRSTFISHRPDMGWKPLAEAALDFVKKAT